MTKKEHNSQVREWMLDMRRDLKRQIRMMTSSEKKELVRSLRYRTESYDKIITKIAFQFAQHGVFWHYGVGRGYVREGGKVVRGRNSTSVEKLVAARKNRVAGKVLNAENTAIKRQPKEWFDPIYEKRIDSLGDILANYHGDDFFAEFDRMKINR